ncbi:hypothetical protein [Agrobacterium genomosp. 13]|uniref:hypothetical protein n=1 Tax=Agrobacterium genomosp. 13 TaxID=1183419 RepID=UPI0027E50801|nr:hypothetical protein [Agrobacterium genomosp. 13]
MAKSALFSDPYGNFSGDRVFEILPGNNGWRAICRNVARPTKGKQNIPRAGQVALQRFGIPEMLFFPLTKQFAPPLAAPETDLQARVRDCNPFL